MSHRNPGATRQQPSLSSSSTQATLLQQRIIDKKAELENLKQLRDLSAGLAGQMEQLEEKLGTLSSGTEAVAAVLSNWDHVLQAITMASSKIPNPKDDLAAEGQGEPELPQTLVRIPVQHLKTAPATADAADDADASVK